MLTITILGDENYDEELQRFTYPNAFVLDLEHSLVSLSKWESNYEKPFLTKDDKSAEEVVYYIKCMTLTPNVPPEVFQDLTQDNLNEVAAYLESKQTATWFNEIQPQAQSREVITSELLYYWIFSFQIAMECEYWNLNRLLTLLKVFNLKNAKPKKMSRAEIAERNRSLNAQRKAEMRTSG